MWKKYGTVLQAIDGNIIRRMCRAIWIRLQLHTQNM